MALIDDRNAGEFLGKVALLGITYRDHEDNLLEQKQWIGIITAFSQKEGVRIPLKDLNEPCCLPPDDRGIKKAPPGIYRLESTGEEVENPDYLISWTYVKDGASKNPPRHFSGKKVERCSVLAT